MSGLYTGCNVAPNARFWLRSGLNPNCQPNRADIGQAAGVTSTPAPGRWGHAVRKLGVLVASGIAAGQHGAGLRRCASADDRYRDRDDRYRRHGYRYDRYDNHRYDDRRYDHDRRFTLGVKIVDHDADDRGRRGVESGRPVVAGLQPPRLPEPGRRRLRRLPGDLGPRPSLAGLEVALRRACSACPTATSGWPARSTATTSTTATPPCRSGAGAASSGTLMARRCSGPPAATTAMTGAGAGTSPPT